MIQLAWLWPRHQPGSALARKLLVALWKWVEAGVVIEGAVLKSAAKAR